jgi:hypothetical protein
MEKKVIKMKESELAQIIETVVEKVLVERKQEWIAEQKAKNEAILEEKVKAIVGKVVKEQKTK